MSAPGPVDSIRKALAVTYTAEGVEIWLTSQNRGLDYRRPIDLIYSGHIDKVWHAIELIGDVTREEFSGRRGGENQ